MPKTTRGITGGEWRISPVLKSGATINIQIGEGDCDWRVGDFIRVLPNNRNDDKVETTHNANAKLIIAAVNACKSINPSHPEYVAERIGEMYEALKKITKSGVIYPAGGFDDVFEVLADIERKE